MQQSQFGFHGGQPFRLQIQDVVVEAHRARRHQRGQRDYAEHGQHQVGPTQEELLDARPRRLCGHRRGSAFAVDQQQKRRQYGHHPRRRDQHSAAGDHAKLRNSAKTAQPHREKCGGVGDACRDNARTGVCDSRPNRIRAMKTLAQFLRVSGNELNTEIDPQSENHDRKRHGDHVQMTHRERRVSHADCQHDHHGGDEQRNQHTGDEQRNPHHSGKRHRVQ